MELKDWLFFGVAAAGHVWGTLWLIGRCFNKHQELCEKGRCNDCPYNETCNERDWREQEARNEQT